ncbi:hypothetical protein GYMLUDRAFT_253631 [Collybiopsis luxurians FD-317 M1]|uniref:Uncharacterized protein n=1 Tax=Collybiopsis luxurians FD-317 M1 TaxID=944289 RepID=A0A0D0C4K1_9AGAR|nr:hypothetical protein GYMLUDRAFT_253631 [Collybiopsis luxurians FD-317 M1]
MEGAEEYTIPRAAAYISSTEGLLAIEGQGMLLDVEEDDLILSFLKTVSIYSRMHSVVLITYRIPSLEDYEVCDKSTIESVPGHIDYRTSLPRTPFPSNLKHAQVIRFNAFLGLNRHQPFSFVASLLPTSLARILPIEPSRSKTPSATPTTDSLGTLTFEIRPTIPAPSIRRFEWFSVSTSPRDDVRMKRSLEDGTRSIRLHLVRVQDVYSTALTHYPKWRWKTKRSEHFPLPSMEWYRHPKPPTLATVFSAPDSGHSAYRKVGTLMLSQRTHDNVLQSHSTLPSSVKLIVQIQNMPIYGRESKIDSAKLA